MRWLFVLLITTSCGTRLVAVDSSVSVQPAQLVFGPTATGDTRTLPLTVSNGSRASATLHLSAPAPFALELDVALEAGQSKDIDVAFAPIETAVALATLHVTGDLALDVSLLGTGVDPAICTAPSSCRVSTRDPATNRCVLSNRADGTACGADNACLEQGQCIAGECIGTAKSCDDQNACTVDACEPVGGCLHSERTCEEPPRESCRVALCDPATGCSTAPAADGTECGPADCTTAHVCMAGACKVLAVPDGYACGEATPCRARGRCSAQTCIQPAPVPLTETWSLTLPDTASFQGLTDAAGNLYWVDCTANVCSLSSVSPAGTLRYRVPTPVISMLPSQVRQLSSGGRIVLAGIDGTIASHAGADGSLVWARANRGLTVLTELAADHRGQLVTLSHSGSESASSRLETLSAATGASIRTQVLNGPARGLLLDAQDNVYLEVIQSQSPVGAASFTDFGEDRNGAPPGQAAMVHFLSFSPVGVLRFNVALDHSSIPTALFNGEVLHGDGVLRSSLDGSQHGGTSDLYLSLPGVSLMGQASRYLWTADFCCPTCDCSPAYDTPVKLHGRVPGTQTERFSRAVSSTGPSAGFASDPLLLADGSALFANLLPTETDVMLRSVATTGTDAFACKLGAAHPNGPNGDFDTWTGATALSQGNWVIAQQTYCASCVHNPPPVLRAYPVPNVSLSATGWTNPNGSPGRTNSPR